MLIGNNIVLVIYGIFMAIILEPFIRTFSDSEMVILTMQTLISTIIILITGEFLPKTLFRINPNFILNFFAVPVMFFYIIFYPISQFTIVISNLLFKWVFKVDLKNSRSPKVFEKIDLDDFIGNINSSNENDTEIEPELKIFQNALDFSQVKLKECKVPRTEIIGLDIDESIDSLKQKFIETGVSKILIYKDNIDNIIGYVNGSDLFKNPKSIKPMLNQIIIVPEIMPANKLLREFINHNKGIAILVDEFGGTSGMVTIEDVIEELTGEIEDEHDKPEYTEKQISKNEFIFSGRIEIDYINEKYNLQLPISDDYETVAGLILMNFENIPKINDVIETSGKPSYLFKILEVSKTKIDLVRITVLD